MSKELSQVLFDEPYTPFLHGSESCDSSIKGMRLGPVLRIKWCKKQSRRQHKDLKAP